MRRKGRIVCFYIRMMIAPSPPMKSRTFATEMALDVLAYNLKRVINIVGIKPLIAAIRAWQPRRRLPTVYHRVVDNPRRSVFTRPTPPG